LRTQSATATLTRAVTVAAGVFAPGHLSELTQYLPFEPVDDVLEQTRTVQRRLRVLPSRAGVYFVLALAMSPRLGYLRVWGKLTAGLAGLDLPRPSEKALRDLRRRLGPAPLKALFEVVAGPLAQPHTPGVRFAGLRTVAFDGLNSVKVPYTCRNPDLAGEDPPSAGPGRLSGPAADDAGRDRHPRPARATVGSVSNRDEARLARRLLHQPDKNLPGAQLPARRPHDLHNFAARPRQGQPRVRRCQRVGAEPPWLLTRTCLGTCALNTSP
jgi:hypothetical protein